MKWKINNTGKRIRTFFAFFPVCIGDECRWLEKVTVEQRYIESYVSPDALFFSAYWENVKFL